MAIKWMMPRREEDEEKTVLFFFFSLASISFSRRCRCVEGLSMTMEAKADERASLFQSGWDGLSFFFFAVSSSSVISASASLSIERGGSPLSVSVNPAQRPKQRPVAR